MKNIGSSQTPWDSIKGIGADGLKRNLMTIYDKVLKKDGTIQKLIQEKREYLGEHGDEEEIPDSVNVTQWTTFLPPLRDTKQGSIYNVTSEFLGEMERDLKQGRIAQFDKLSVIKGKITSFSIKILEEIQNIVKSEPALLETMGGEPFLQNVCCNDVDNVKTLNYFTDKNGDIKTHNKKVMELIKIYNDTLRLANSPFMMSNEDTKVKYPKLSNEYDEDIIYKAFIYYCNFTKDFPINESFRMLCTEKIDMDGETDVSKQIEIIKSKGVMYSEETLLHLLKLVARENYVNLNLDGDIYSSKQSILQLMKNIEEHDDEMDSELLTLMTEMIENYDEVRQIHSSKLREVRNYLITNTETLKTEITEFLSKHSSYSGAMKRRLLETLNTISEFSTTNDDTMLLTDNELTTVNMVTTIKNMIHDMTSVFPNIVINKVDYEKVKPPTHWKLSQIHTRDIITFMKKNYSQIKQLYGNKEVLDIMENIDESCKNIRKLVSETIFSSSLNNDETEHSKLFEFSLVREFYTYLFYYTCHKYIEVQEELNLAVDVVEDVEESKGSPDEMVEVDVLSGDNLKYKQEIARILMTYLEIFARQKSRINYNRSEIMELVLRSKEKEKDIKTRQLKALTDEERKTDGELRKAKLGRWNIGLQKGLTQYVKDTYDMERKEMEQEALVDRELGQLDVVNDMNRELYAMDFLEQQQRNEDANAEAFDMTGLAEDDDYGDDKVGDEAFY